MNKMEKGPVRAITSPDIRGGIRDIGGSGRIICVHSSLRSFGRVEGGAQAVIQAFLDVGCTLLVPTFSWSYAIDPPPHLRPPRNGWDYGAYQGTNRGFGRSFTPASTDVDKAMGAIPAAVAGWPSRHRGLHPLCSFTAVGPQARDLVSNQSPRQVFAPLAQLCQRGGQILLIGVGLNRMTLLHYAEQMAGRRPFLRWASGPDGEPMMAESGGCSDGFEAFRPVCDALKQEVTVGSSAWTAYPPAELVERVAAALRANPGMAHCPDPHCLRCRDAMLGGPMILPSSIP